MALIVIVWGGGEKQERDRFMITFRGIFDFLVGLDTEFSESINGSHLYSPNVSLDDVVLPEATKARFGGSICMYNGMKDVSDKYEVGKNISYGFGQVLLFYGSSGTGKTMMANPVATKPKKTVFLVNFASLGTNSSAALIKFLF